MYLSINKPLYMYHFFKTWILHRGGNGDQRNCLTGEGQKIGGRDSI